MMNEGQKRMQNFKISIPKTTAGMIRAQVKLTGLSFNELINIAIIWGVTTNEFYDDIYNHPNTLESWKEEHNKFIEDYNS